MKSFTNGAQITPRGDGLRVIRDNLLTDSDRAAIRRYKSEVIILLRLPGATFDGELWEWNSLVAPTKATSENYGRRYRNRQQGLYAEKQPENTA